MRVLALTNLWASPQQPYGGTFIINRLLSTAAIGVDVTYCHLHYRPRRPLERELSWSGLRRVETTCTRLPAFRPSLKSYLLLKRSSATSMETEATRFVTAHCARSAKFDIVHAHGMYAPSAGVVAMRVAAELGIPFVVSFHGTDVNGAGQEKLRTIRAVTQRAAAVSFVSEELKDRAEQLGISAPCSAVVPNGVDVDLFHPREGTRAATDTRLRTVGFLGRLTHVKGADRLIDIVRLTSAASDRVRFVVGGAGPLEADLRRRARGLPIEFLGAVRPDAVPEFMSSLDLLIIPSRSEGWPTVVFEAYACGVPVIGTDVGGTGSAIGDATHVVSDGDGVEQRLADRIVTSLERSADPAALRHRAEAHTWGETARREAEILQRAVSDWKQRDHSG